MFVLPVVPMVGHSCDRDSPLVVARRDAGISTRGFEYPNDPCPFFPDAPSGAAADRRGRI